MSLLTRRSSRNFVHRKSLNLELTEVYVRLANAFIFAPQFLLHVYAHSVKCEGPNRLHFMLAVLPTEANYRIRRNGQERKK